MLPRVIIHTATSLDGRTRGFPADEGLYYELAATWSAQAMLTGADTLLAAPWGPEEDAPAEPQPPDPADTRQWLVLTDSRGRFHHWRQVRAQPYWRGALVLCSHATPAVYLQELEREHIPSIVAGEGQVDLRAALAELRARYGIEAVRVDSGGSLNGALLAAGLVTEVSVLVQPSLVGRDVLGTYTGPAGLCPDLAGVRLRLLGAETVRGDAVWLRYEVVQ